ncbi:ADP-ribosylglycohydrolase family protein [Xanthomonadaceae bacterium XH05]|nr:ADP-ribosylglycohydrolase family protein [Xanthomonadaceae bacterium XH05]
MNDISQQDRHLGCLLGLAVGDALGTTLEFKRRGSFTPITDMLGGGPFELEPGQWTDDTSMALCLAESLIECEGFDADDQMRRYCRWQRDGHLSSTGQCFDIGNTTAAALRRYRQSGNPFSGSTDPHSAGNGCLMRLAPVPMRYFNDESRLLRLAADSARTTHAAPEAVECTQLFALILRQALLGHDKPGILTAHGWHGTIPSIAAIAAGHYRDKPESQIHGSGYVVQSLEAALWCFHHTDNYHNAVLLAANLGDDADTTAAICGQLAGAHYGVMGIPQEWREKLTWRQGIEHFALKILALCGEPGHGTSTA